MSKFKQHKGVSWHVVLGLLFLMTAVMAWRGYDFYFLSLDDRVEHPDYRDLRSSGTVGYGYGVAGTLLIFTNLLYLARRRLTRWKLGSIKTWLDLHVFTGLAGSLFISFHSTFKARNTVAQLTSWSLFVVVVTGLVGRFLYALVPRHDEQGFQNALDELGELSPQASAAISDGITETMPPPPGEVPPWRLPHYLFQVLRARDRHRDIIKVNVDLHGAMMDPNSRSRLCKRLLRSNRQTTASYLASACLKSWRRLHLFAAILMLLTVVFHIGIAWYYGYRWIWSE